MKKKEKKLLKVVILTSLVIGIIVTIYGIGWVNKDIATVGAVYTAISIWIIGMFLK
jgi:hypothetical protein